jgi:hypothetical protein
MRVSLCSMLFLLSTLGIAFGQDTNFSSGPQYLLNGSPLFARSISTPSITLTDAPLQVGASNATGVLIAGAGNQTVLPPAPDAPPMMDLFPIYYGPHQPSVIEISFASDLYSNQVSSNELSKTELPESILDTGVSEITTVETLHARGYGLSVVEGAAYGKVHMRHANRVYTNADIDRLHSGS